MDIDSKINDLHNRLFQLELKVAVMEQAMLILANLKPAWYHPPVWNGVEETESEVL